MADSDVKAALGSSLYAIEFGMILWVAAGATLVLLLVPTAVDGLVTLLTQSAFGATTSIAIAAILLAFGIYVVWSSQRNLKDRIRAKIEEERRKQAETTLEKGAWRPPIMR